VVAVVVVELREEMIARHVFGMDAVMGAVVDVGSSFWGCRGRSGGIVLMRMVMIGWNVGWYFER